MVSIKPERAMIIAELTACSFKQHKRQTIIVDLRGQVNRVRRCIYSSNCSLCVPDPSCRNGPPPQQTRPPYSYLA